MIKAEFFLTSDGGNILWPGSDVKKYRHLNPGYHEVGSLSDDAFLNTLEPKHAKLRFKSEE